MKLTIALCITILIIVGLIVLLKESTSDKFTYNSIPILFFITILNVIILFILLSSLKEPKPIDVYRNNTTLKITYKDSIPIDSVVVWKNK